MPQTPAAPALANAYAALTGIRLRSLPMSIMTNQGGGDDGGDDD